MDKLGIVNGALIELGAEPLTSLSVNSTEADTANAVYDSVYADMLGKAPWRFAVKKQTLSRDVATPPNEWTYQFSLPAQLLSILRVYPSAPYELFQGKLYAHAQDLAVDFIERVSESLLSPPFARLLILELAARMCMTITNDPQLKVSLQNDARLQFAAALAADAQQRPNVPLQSSPFVDVRY